VFWSFLRGPGRLSRLGPEKRPKGIPLVLQGPRYTAGGGANGKYIGNVCEIGQFGGRIGPIRRGNLSKGMGRKAPTFPRGPPDLILRSGPGRAGNRRFWGSKGPLSRQDPLEKVLGEDPHLFQWALR
jgi:hypothetical protein